MSGNPFGRRLLFAYVVFTLCNQHAQAQNIIDTKAVGGPTDSSGNFQNPTKFVIASNGWMYGCFNTGVFASVSQGISWTALTYSGLTDFCFGPDSTLYLAADSGLYSSTNFGATWTNLSNQLPNGPFNSIIVTVDGTIMTSCPAGIFMSTDQGTTWDHIAQSVFPEAGTGAYLTTSLKGTVMARNGNTYYRSIDDGATWETSVPLTIQIWPISITNILRQGTNGLERSTDDGVSWHPIPGSPKGLEYDVAMDVAGNLFTFYGWQLYISRDSGTTWSVSRTISGGGEELAFAPDNTLFFSKPSEGIWRTLKPLSKVQDISDAVADSLGLYFDGAHDISFRLSQPSEVHLRLLDEAGRIVTSLTEGTFEPGNYSVAIGTALSPGPYFCEIQAGTSQKTVKIVLQ